MRLLMNKNIPMASIKLLRKNNDDICSVLESFPGVSDKAVMQYAHNEKRVIVTFDSDYGELVFRHKLPLPLGVLYLRFIPLTPDEPAEYIINLINKGVELEGKFTTADKNQIRQRSIS